MTCFGLCSMQKSLCLITKVPKPFATQFPGGARGPLRAASGAPRERRACPGAPAPQGSPHEFGGKAPTGIRTCSLTVILALTLCHLQAQDKINYTDHIMPLIEANCSKCHNSDKKK